jgi:hypothetical protein
LHRFSRWKIPLTEALTVEQVVGLMSAYVATVSPQDRASLPEVCRRALTVEDIAGSAVILVREELQFAGDAAIGEMLHELAHTFVAASSRIASIQARGQPTTTAVETAL